MRKSVVFVEEIIYIVGIPRSPFLMLCNLVTARAWSFPVIFFQQLPSIPKPATMSAASAVTMGRLSGKVALITGWRSLQTLILVVRNSSPFPGASSGIGAATAILFSSLGADLALSGRNVDNLRKTGEQCEAAKAGGAQKKPLLVPGAIFHP